MDAINFTAKCRIGILMGLLLPMGGLKAESGGLVASERTALGAVDLKDFPASIQMALDGLKKAEILESAYVGFTGAPSENLKLLRTLLSYDDAKAVLISLYDEGNLVAKMYAIIGLQLHDEFDLAQSLIKDAYQYQAESIHAMEGCVIFQRGVQAVLKDISDGYYAEMFSEDG